GRQGMNDGDENEGGEENSQGGKKRALPALYQIADEGCRRENRPRRELRDRVEQLLIREPAKSLHKIAAQECQQDVAATVENGPYFKKGQEKRRQAYRDHRQDEAGGDRRQRAPPLTDAAERKGENRRERVRFALLPKPAHRSEQEAGGDEQNKPV